MTNDITSKTKYSLERIRTFQGLISKSKDLNAQADFCIYTTGSYGRLEASEFSDLDLFFLSDNDQTKFSKISEI